MLLYGFTSPQRVNYTKVNCHSGWDMAWGNIGNHWYLLIVILYVSSGWIKVESQIHLILLTVLIIPLFSHCIRNAEGCTPFMQAVCNRAYPAATVIFDTAKKLATRPDKSVDRELLLSMIYPPGSSLDNSPLHVLCCNDTCSFTWTGAEHINQVCMIQCCLNYGTTLWNDCPGKLWQKKRLLVPTSISEVLWDKSTLDQVTAWIHQAPSHFLN